MIEMVVLKEREREGYGQTEQENDEEGKEKVRRKEEGSLSNPTCSQRTFISMMIFQSQIQS